MSDDARRRINLYLGLFIPPLARERAQLGHEVESNTMAVPVQLSHKTLRYGIHALQTISVATDPKAAPGGIWMVYV